MKKASTLLLAVAAIGLAVLTPTSARAPDSEDWKQLSAEWWQWALSIPAPQTIAPQPAGFPNPLLDTTGENCMVGQRGSVWFLAGTFYPLGPSVTRTCSVPENKALFFPVYNSVWANSPNVCGQGPDNLSVKDMRAYAAYYVDAVTDISVQLDGREIKARRVKSEVFEIALPPDNLFVPPCGGDSPAGIYSPAVDDGFYAEVDPLKVGNHTLHFQAQSQGTTLQDVTYTLTVVPVLTH